MAQLLNALFEVLQFIGWFIGAVLIALSIIGGLLLTVTVIAIGGREAMREHEDSKDSE